MIYKVILGIILIVVSIILLVFSQLSYNLESESVAYEVAHSDKFSHYFLSTHDMKITQSGDTYEFIKGTKKFTVQQETVFATQPPIGEEAVETANATRYYEKGFIINFMIKEKWGELKSDSGKNEYVAPQDKCPFISFTIQEGDEIDALSKGLIDLNCHKTIQPPTLNGSFV